MMKHGVLLIDHSGGQGPDGQKGRKEEYDIVTCRHCQAIIKMVVRGCTRAYETKFRCEKCAGPICRHCGEVLKGECSPILAKVEKALKTGVWDDRHVHHYNTVGMKG